MSVKAETILPIADVPWGGGRHDFGKNDHNEQFYWNGVDIHVDTKSANVAGTAFGERCRELSDEVANIMNSCKPAFDAMKTLTRHIILHIMPLLDEIAPAPNAWRAVEDYYHTPSYHILLSAEDDADDAVVRITERKEVYAQGLVPTSLHTFELPSDIPRFQANELVIVDQLKGFLAGLHATVTLPDGTIAVFVPCRRPSRRQNGTYENSSFRELTFHLHVHKLQLSNSLRIPRLLGIVTTETTDTLLAGVLINHTEGTALMDSEESIRATDQHAHWKEQLRSTTAVLHQAGVKSLGIHPNNLIIDSESGVWLSSFTGHEIFHSRVTEERNDTDNAQIDLIFDQWLPGEQVAEIAGTDLGDEADARERRRKARFMRCLELIRKQKAKQS